jgi:MFS family permease
MFFDIILFLASNRGFIFVFRIFQLLFASLTATCFTSCVYVIYAEFASHSTHQTPSSILLMLTFGAIIGNLLGHYLAAPGLLLFFVWSLWAWNKKTPSFLVYALTGGVIAGCNGAFYFTQEHDCAGDCLDIMPPVGYPELILFIASGLATAALHWRWRNKERLTGSIYSA